MAPTRIVLVPAGTVMSSSNRKMPIPSSNRVAIPSTSYAPSAQVKMERAVTPRRIDPLELLNPTPISKTRKRERLTALTAEEKLARRKMKNRVAAQTARDRKKERTFGLEDCVKDLVDENRRLREENEKLMERLTRLEQEAAMRRDAPATPSMYTTNHTTHPISYPSTTVVTPLGSAASINDLQQRAQAVTTMSSKKSMVDRMTLVRIMMVLLSSLPSKSTPFSKISEMSTSIKCVPLSTRVSKERKERLTLTLHRLLSKRPRPIPRHPP